MKARVTPFTRVGVALSAVAVVALALSLGPGTPTAAGGGPQITLKPSKGPAGISVTVNGSGFVGGSKVEITWEGNSVAQAQSIDGSFVADFEVPQDTPGEHKVVACAYTSEPCDAGEAVGTFTLEEEPATSEPTKVPPSAPPSAPPSDPPTPAPPPTAVPPTVGPTVGPTAAPSIEPPPIVIPPGTIDLPPIPWLDTANGPCTDIPFAQPYTTYDFERGLTFIASGERMQPPQGARSGTMALASRYDDFGSSGKPILLDFYHPYSEIALFVGREQPTPGAGSVTALVTAYGWLADGSVGIVASASRELEEAAIPTQRCIHLTAPAGMGIRSIAVEYIDQNGDSAYERRWIDDVVVTNPTRITAPRTTTQSTVSIVTPANGSTLSQLASAPVHVVADVHYFYFGRPTVAMRVNHTGATNGSLGMIGRRADDGDPTHWIFEADVMRDLIDDDVNEIAVYVRPPPGTREIHAVTNFSIRAPVAGNLRVVAIEVNQAVQEPGNRVPLIADKRTVVRVYVEGTPDGRGPWGPVTGLLSTVAADGTTRNHSPLAPTTPASGRISSYGTDSQLIFLLDRAETATGLLRLNASLRPVAPRPQTNTDDDRMTTSVRFIEPLRYTAYGVLFAYPTGETNTWSTMENFMRYVENVFPVSSAQIVPVPGIGTSVQVVGDINALRDRTGSLQSRLPPDVSIFGLWPGSGSIPALCNAGICQTGLAYFRRTDGIGDPNQGPRVMAQELAHAEGLWWHAETPGEPAAPPFGFWNPTWPWTHASIGHVGMDTRNPTAPMVVAPYFGRGGHVHDFMSYGAVPAWVSPFTYCVMLEDFTDNVDRCPEGTRDMPRVEFFGGTPAASGIQAPANAVAAAHRVLLQVSPGAEVEYLLVRGEIAWDAESATFASVESVFRSGERPSGATGDAFTLEIRDAAGVPLTSQPFAPVLTHFHEGEPVPFELTLARPDGATSIALLRGETVLAEIRASANAPTLLVDTSAMPAELNDPFELTWDAEDADGDPVAYVVEASFDDRQTWWPIAVELTDSHLLVTPDTLPGSSAAWFRVQVSDGFHSVSQIVGPVAIPTHAPTIRLSSPPDGAVIDERTPLLLEATSMDLEDGQLDGDAIAWASDRDGALGTGPWIVVETLSAGRHIISGTATDSDDQVTSVELRVTVLPAAQGAEPSPSASPAPSPVPTQSTPMAPSSLPTSPASSLPPGVPQAGSSAISAVPVIGGLLVLLIVAGAVVFVILRRRPSRSG